MVLPQQKHDFAFDGLIVGQQFFKVFRRKWPFRISGEVWGFGLRCCQAFVVLRGVKAKIVAHWGKTMFFALSVIVLGDSRARPLHVSTLSFVIVSWLEVVVFRGFSHTKAMSGDVGLKL